MSPQVPPLDATRAIAVRTKRVPAWMVIPRGPGPEEAKEEANVAGAVSNQRLSSPSRAYGGRVHALGAAAAANESRTA